jgi:hypothetical protein
MESDFSYNKRISHFLLLGYYHKNCDNIKVIKKIFETKFFLFDDITCVQHHHNLSNKVCAKLKYDNLKKTSFHCYSLKKLCTYGRPTSDQTLKRLR